MNKEAMKIRGYKSASDYLGTEEDRPLMDRTRLHRLSGSSISVRCHDTNYHDGGDVLTTIYVDVVTYHSDGRIILRRRMQKNELFLNLETLTKIRINQYAPVKVSQRNGEWFVKDASYVTRRQFPIEKKFIDGMELLDSNGSSDSR